MRRGWNGGELEVKDLEHMWASLKKEENIQWTLEDTVVLSECVTGVVNAFRSVLTLPAATATPST